MLRTRVIPVLLLRDGSLVKTVKFKKFNYVGDPCNTVRIFNELEVDELIFLDINATKYTREPNYELLADIANECFMPLAYGGGIKDFAQAQKIFEIGFEKVAINFASTQNEELIKQLSEHFGSQSIIASIDVKTSFFGKQRVVVKNGKIAIGKSPVEWARTVQAMGAGEILLTSIPHEGTWQGFDVELVKQVAEAVNIPVIAHGGGGSVDDIGKVVKQGKASAVALGSMVVYQKEGMGVLINFPEYQQLESVLKS